MQARTLTRNQRADSALDDGIPTKSTWRAFAACFGMTHLPWVSDEESDVALCRAVCRQCEVMDWCADEVMQVDLTADESHEGTMGGMSSAQRVWLRSNPALANDVADDCAAAGCSVHDLSDLYETEGPSLISPEVSSLPDHQIAVRYGVGPDTFKRWMSARGVAHAPKRKRKSAKMHTGAYRLAERHMIAAIHDGGDGWVGQSEITQILMDKRPWTDIAHTQKAHTEGARSAWGNLAYSIIQSWLRAGRVTQRPDPANRTRRQIRWVTDAQRGA